MTSAPTDFELPPGYRLRKVIGSDYKGQRRASSGVVQGLEEASSWGSPRASAHRAILNRDCILNRRVSPSWWVHGGLPNSIDLESCDGKRLKAQE